MGKSLRFGLIVLLSSFLILFQNCGIQNSNFEDLNQINEDISAQSLPFAFDLDVDQIAYMSCTGTVAQISSKLFTFRAGGYAPGSGVSLKSNYLASVSSDTLDQRLFDLEANRRNAGTGVNMALRFQNNLQDYYLSDDSAGRSIGFMMFDPSFMRLSSPDVAQFLFQNNGQPVNYISGIGGLSGKSFDADLSFAEDENQALTVRAALANSLFLSFTFMDPDSGINSAGIGITRTVESPYIDSTGSYAHPLTATRAFGKGYTLRFQQRHPSLQAFSQPRKMSVDLGINLENQTALSESWNCDDLIFTIVRPQDASRPFIANNIHPTLGTPLGRLTCERLPDMAVGNQTLVIPAAPNYVPSQQEISFSSDLFKKIRNTLPASDWWVNLPQKCIVPKSGFDECYASYDFSNPLLKVIYDPAQDTNPECDAGTTPNYCPHYVSICYKQ